MRYRYALLVAVAHTLFIDPGAGEAACRVGANTV